MSVSAAAIASDATVLTSAWLARSTTPRLRVTQQLT
jgi:hypothetical protein